MNVLNWTMIVAGFVMVGLVMAYLFVGPKRKSRNPGYWRTIRILGLVFAIVTAALALISLINELST